MEKKALNLAIKHKLGNLMQFCKSDEKAFEEIQDLIKLLNLEKEFTKHKNE